MTCALYTFLLNYEFHFWKIISPYYPCLLQPQVLPNPNAILSWVQPLMFEESGTPKETLKEILNFRKPWWVHKTNKKAVLKRKYEHYFKKLTQTVNIQLKLISEKNIPRKMFNKLSYDSQLICETALSFIWKNIYQL